MDDDQLRQRLEQARQEGPGALADVIEELLKQPHVPYEQVRMVLGFTEPVLRKAAEG